MAHVETAAPDQSPPAPPPAASPRRVPWIPILVIGGLFVTGALAGLSVLGKSWYPVGDDATIVLLVRDVGHHTPLVGFNSRYLDPHYAWSHPGPWTFWLLALPYHLLGDAPSAILVGAGFVNAVAVALFAWVSYRRGGTALLLWAGFLILVVVHATGFGILRGAWNPWIAVLPFALFLIAAWAVTCGDLIMAPLAVLAGSFAFDNHAGYALLVGGVLVWTVGVIAFDARRIRRAGDQDAWRAHRTRLLRIGGASLVLGLLFWSPVLYEQFTGHPGNLTRTLRFFQHDTQTRVTPRQALQIFGAEVGVHAAWLGWKEFVDVTAQGLPGRQWPLTGLLTIAVFIATGVLAFLRRARDAFRLHLLVTVAIVAALVSLVSLRGARYTYLYRWLWVIAMFMVLASGWAVFQSLRAPTRERFARFAQPVLAVAFVALTFVTCLTQWTDPMPTQVLGPEVHAITGPATRAVDPDRPVLVRREGPTFALPFGGLLVGLEQHGIHVLVDPQFEPSFREHRTIQPGQRVGQTLTVVETDPVIAKYLADPTQQLVTRYVPTRADLRNGVEPAAVFLSRVPVVG